ncbi:alpha/beta hydrolase [Nocardiopsis aegyptia]|uniref:Uncharacterized protein (UPF0335 family) n=1 Tax=Nocardiopsis aegyptia TaxID=220378 RepID=A0A7Z0EM08_9ACTN|nr:alpha/beta hydrolase [Nocardiopsis aegyptia]NYJ34041.1 uncharacterized protein (UPF0335 family) [Nocardiopsis aegyptia]
MSISDVSLGLPSDIDADVGAINDGAETLDGICATMYGRSQDLDGQFNSSASEFSDLVAWDISSASAQELQSWWEAGRALTHGAAVLRLWGEDIGTYRETRADLEERFQTAKRNAQARVDNPIASAAASGRTGGLVEGIVDAAANNRAEREEQEVMALNGYACELLVEHTTAWDLLMDQADLAKKDLRNGPSEETMERLVESGHLSSNQLGFFPSDDVPLEEFIESAGPASVNTWWTSLDEEQQQEAMEDHPELLRDLDGIPTVVRDELNREHLDEEIERLEAEVAEAEEGLNDAVRSPSSPNADVDDSIATNDLSELEEQLETLTTMHGSLNDDNADRYLLALDTEDRGRAIVSNGNPDTAENVATLVPGTTTTWQSTNDQMGRANSLVDAANDAVEGDHAVISWIGYDAPNISEAAGPGRAEDAVDELSSFQDGLRATHENASPSHNTVIGHSYGSTVVGHTAQSDDGLNADEVVFVGSPGPGADHVSELGFDPENVHASRAENDGISVTPDAVHGVDPTDPDFGATVFDSSPGTELPNWAGRATNPLGDAHSEYFNDDTASLEYMGEVIAGRK